MGYSNQKNNHTHFNSTKISCNDLGDLHNEAKHDFSGSLIHTYAPKDYDGEGKGFIPTDLLASEFNFKINLRNLFILS
tara:strand:- start:691 stop:924 length:234 start_codon:yes stop_codon:yes gene_type:complete